MGQKLGQKQIEEILCCKKCYKAETGLCDKSVIHEGAVVLMGMETEQRFEDLMVAFDEMGFMPYTTHPFPEEYVETWKQRLIFVFGQLRKETAEKFAERLKAEYDAIGGKLQKSYDEVFGSDLPEWSVPDVVNSYGYIDKIDEICKKITEGES